MDRRDDTPERVAVFAAEQRVAGELCAHAIDDLAGLVVAEHPSRSEVVEILSHTNLLD